MSGTSAFPYLTSHLLSFCAPWTLSDKLNQEMWKIAADRRLSYKRFFNPDLHPQFLCFVDLRKFGENQIKFCNVLCYAETFKTRVETLQFALGSN